MSEILTYLDKAKYSTNANTFKGQVKEGKNGSFPIKNNIHRGNYQQNTGGNNWWGNTDSQQDDSKNGSMNANDPFDQGSTGKGMHYWMVTNSNGKQLSRWFDFGDLGGYTDGSNAPGTAQSCWLRDVTGLWFLFNGNDTTETRDCYARIEQAALRYVDKDNKVRILKVTDKLGDIGYNDGHRGTSRRVFGYQLNSTNRSIVYDNDYKLLGCRVQFKLKRGASGTTNDRVQAGMTACRFSLHGAHVAEGTSSSKRVLVGYGNQTLDDFLALDKLRLETRP